MDRGGSERSGLRNQGERLKRARQAPYAPSLQALFLLETDPPRPAQRSAAKNAPLAAAPGQDWATQCSAAQRCTRGCF